MNSSILTSGVSTFLGVDENAIAAPTMQQTDVLLFSSLAKKGLDCLTDSNIEHVMCTSALAAFN